jgi:hypothetical protein
MMGYRNVDVDGGLLRMVTYLAHMYGWLTPRLRVIPHDRL